MKKPNFYFKLVFIFIIMLLNLNFKAVIPANAPLYLKVLSNYMIESHIKASPWKDIAIKFSKPVRFMKNNKAIQLLINSKAVPIKTQIDGDVLYIHPTVPYSYNKKYTVKIPENSVISLDKIYCNSNITINFITQNITDYNTLGLEDFMESAIQFYDFMISNYPYFNMTKSVTGFDFQKNKDDIINTLTLSKDKDEFNTNLAIILNKLLPGTHTKAANLTIYVPDSFMFIYLNGEYVIVNSSNPDIQIGDTVTKINGKNIDKYIAEGNNVLVSNIDLQRKKLYASSSRFLSSDSLTFTISNATNDPNDVKVNLKKINNDATIYLQPAKPTTYDITTNIITKDQIAYIKIPTFTTLDFNKVNDFISSIQGYKDLIVDVRNNAGGDLGYAKQLISSLIQAPNSIFNYVCLKNIPTLNNKYKQADNFYDDTTVLSNSEKKSLIGLPAYVKNDSYNVYKVKINLAPATTHFNGKVYVLTNGSCFSACEYFCNTIKRIGGATLVGEYTGGDGILFIPESKTFLFNLANMSFSYTIGLQDDGKINQLNHTAPDYYVEQDKDDFVRYINEKGDFSDYDTVLNKCLDIISQASN